MSAATSKENQINQTPNGSSAEEERFVPEKELFAWQTSARPFKKRSREYWVTVFSIAALLAFILFLAEGVMPVVLIIALVFLYYVLSTVPPDQIVYSITNKGVKIVDKTTPWGQLTRYWFDERMGSDLLIFGSKLFPNRMELVVQKNDIDKIKKVLLAYLPEDKPNKSSVDKAVAWVSQKLPQD